MRPLNNEKLWERGGVRRSGGHGRHGNAIAQWLENESIAAHR